jgi:Flp pilus assembly pilin Flp
LLYSSLTGDEKQLPLPYLAWCTTIRFAVQSDVAYGAGDMFHIKPRMACHEDEAGQGLIEYGLILLLVAVAIAAAVGAFGQTLSNFYLSALDRLPFH